MRKHLGLVIAGTLLIATFSYAKKKEAPHAPLALQVISAKTIYIENHSTASLADMLYSELQTWGKYTVVADPKDADLVFVLSVTMGPSQVGSVPLYDYKLGTYQHKTVDLGGANFTNLSILDRAAGAVVYSDAKPWSRHGATKRIIEELKQRIAETTISKTCASDPMGIREKSDPKACR